MAKKEFCIEEQEIGDIILILNKAYLSSAQIILQSIGSLKIAKYSHAILALSKGIYIEAMRNSNENGNYDIDIFCINELKKRLKNEYRNNWKVIRYKNINSELQEQIFNAANYFYGQKYNSNPLGKIFQHRYKIDSSYCSELVQRIYEKAGITLNHCNRDFWPVHLDLLTIRYKDRWEDITSQYNKKCSNHHQDDFYDDLCNNHKILQKYLYLNNKKNLQVVDNINTAKKIMNCITNNLENIPQSELDQLLKSYPVSRTFHTQFIAPIINKYSIIDYNNESCNFEFPDKTSYLLENIQSVNLITDLKIYKENIKNELQLSFNCISSLTNYVNILLVGMENKELKKQLTVLVESSPTYSEEELLEAKESMLSLKNKYNDDEINQYYEIIKNLINTYRVINIFVKSGILSSDNEIDKNILLEMKDDIENFIKKEFNAHEF